MRKGLAALLLILVAAVSFVGFLGCNKPKEDPLPVPPKIEPGATAPEVHFTDVAQKAGIHFTHYNGSQALKKKYMPETMGSGCAWIDYDKSGRQSLLLLNSTDWPEVKSQQKHAPALFKNNGDGTFTDVTKQAGLADFNWYSMGVAVGDYDNDGYPDLFITTLNGNHLLHNKGDGTFEDVTDKAGVKGPGGWSSSAAFVDYDNDGKLDLFVTYYVVWTPDRDVRDTVDGVTKAYNRPDKFQGQTCRLYHNMGNGKFEDATEKAKIKIEGKSLGVSLLMRPDGWPDIYVANDTVPNFYFVNQKDGTFKENGIFSNVATGENGRAKGGMGTDVGDLHNDGHNSILVSNFSNEMLSLYTDSGKGYFTDTAARAGIGAPSRLSLGFGCFFFDYDLDGYPDIFITTGHIEPEINKVQKQVTYQERPLLFHNQHNGRFQEEAATCGDLSKPMVGRGAAFADYDGDGYPDIAVVDCVGDAHLFHNEGGTGNNHLTLQLEGTTANRSAIGAQVFVKVGAVTEHQWVKSGSSYCSQSQLPLIFGLGKAAQADAVEVQWPGSDKREPLGAVKANSNLKIVQGKGIATRTSVASH